MQFYSIFRAILFHLGPNSKFIHKLTSVGICQSLDVDSSGVGRAHVELSSRRTAIAARFSRSERIRSGSRERSTSFKLRVPAACDEFELKTNWQ